MLEDSAKELIEDLNTDLEAAKAEIEKIKADKSDLVRQLNTKTREVESLKIQLEKSTTPLEEVVEIDPVYQEAMTTALIPVAKQSEVATLLQGDTKEELLESAMKIKRLFGR